MKPSGARRDVDSGNIPPDVVSPDLPRERVEHPLASVAGTPYSDPYASITHQSFAWTPGNRHWASRYSDAGPLRASRAGTWAHFPLEPRLGLA
jgi:hypothetical protein